MLTTSPWLHERSWPSVHEYLQNNDIILVPVGATEQHGWHTPLMVDTGWAIGVCEGAAEAASVLTAPPIHYGWTCGHFAYPGAVTLRAETLINVLVDICQSLMVHGFKKFILVNGNRMANLPPMEIAATKLRMTNGAFVGVLDVGLVARKEVASIVGATEAGLGHAGDAETSYTLFKYGHLVDMTRAQAALPAPVMPSGLAPHHLSLDPGGNWNAVLVKSTPEEFRERSLPHGLTGDATSATRDKGERIYKAVVANTVAFIEDIRNIQVTLRNVAVPV